MAQNTATDDSDDELVTITCGARNCCEKVQVTPKERTMIFGGAGRSAPLCDDCRDADAECDDEPSTKTVEVLLSDRVARRSDVVEARTKYDGEYDAVVLEYSSGKLEQLGGLVGHARIVQMLDADGGA